MKKRLLEGVYLTPHDHCERHNSSCVIFVLTLVGRKSDEFLMWLVIFRDGEQRDASVHWEETTR